MFSMKFWANVFCQFIPYWAFRLAAPLKRYFFRSKEDVAHVEITDAEHDSIKELLSHLYPMQSFILNDTRIYYDLLGIAKCYVRGVYKGIYAIYLQENTNLHTPKKRPMTIIRVKADLNYRRD